MKFKILFVSILIFLLGCKVASDNSANICPQAALSCITPVQFFKLKFVDKSNSNLDLIFGRNAKYNYNDVVIYSIRHNKNLNFTIDSTDRTNKYILFSTPGTDEFSIRLPNLNKDTLMAETAFVNSGCCGSLNITKLTLNKSALPFSNTNPTIILLKK
ncbi:MAG: hypothetical protein KKE39_04770 [Bacteroidetes bacterium]|nr:hypothetical protein [Bacteroidota bacterium]MBU1372394.1 hypothetical protein [Bacteroidota bacterium]MBU1483418.1 hypothetical protein [Bacteroidota bacterium]MBU1761873.1 hypothetical protein [Bacteroidota bacterium]MBU2267337.1 hypothetical protein [Bacteroidota bacterium]